MDAFRAAAAHVIPFGPFQGQTIDAIAESDDGLRYLDNLRGMIEARARYGLTKKDFVHLASLETYLDDPVIMNELAPLIVSQR